jgi:ubiquinone biosynthesis protein
MLYVKNMVFLDGAISRLAPDLDIIAELTTISMTFMQRHGARLSQELGVDMSTIEVDMGSLKQGLGVDASTESMTYRQLQERRDLIQKRMRDHLVK